MCTCRVDASYNKSVRLHSFMCGALGVFLPLLFILSFIVNTISKDQVEELLGEGLARMLLIFSVSSDIRKGYIPTMFLVVVPAL